MSDERNRVDFRVVVYTSRGNSIEVERRCDGFTALYHNAGGLHGPLSLEELAALHRAIELAESDGRLP